MDKKILVPYTKTVAGDTETPITLYQKYVGTDKGVLLESRDQIKGRYSFIAKEFFCEIKSSKLKVEITDENGKIQKEGRVLDIVKEYLDKIKIENTSKIPFVGGAIGTVGYDIIRQYEKLPEKNPEEIGTPESHLFFIDSMIVYDHFHQQITFLALGEKTEEGKRSAGAKIAEMEEKIRTPYVDSAMEKVCSATDIKNMKRW